MNTFIGILERFLGASFNPPVGAIVEIQNGSIEPYIDLFPSNEFGNLVRI